MQIPMRRGDKALPEERAFEILKNGEYGTLSTIGANGYPYGVAVNYASDKEYIYIHGALDGHKLSNIAANPKVCFSVVGNTKLLPQRFSTEYESVIVFGEAELVEGEERRLALMELIYKYSPDFIPSGEKYVNNDQLKTCLIRIKIQQITAKYNNK